MTKESEMTEIRHLDPWDPQFAEAQLCTCEISLFATIPADRPPSRVGRYMRSLDAKSQVSEARHAAHVLAKSRPRGQPFASWHRFPDAIPLATSAGVQLQSDNMQVYLDRIRVPTPEQPVPSRSQRVPHQPGFYLLHSRHSRRICERQWYTSPKSPSP